MAITANAIVLKKKPLESDLKVASLYSADLTGGEDLVAAVTGKYIYVEKIQIITGSVSDGTFDIGAGQSTGVTTIYLGPINVADAGGNIVIDFGPDHAMQIAVSTALSIDQSGGSANPTVVLVWYRIAS